MVAEDSILPASKTLALAQWKISFIFFSHQIDSYKDGKRMWDMETKVKQLLGRYINPFLIRGEVDYAHHNFWGRFAKTVTLIEVISF